MHHVCIVSFCVGGSWENSCRCDLGFEFVSDDVRPRLGCCGGSTATNAGVAFLEACAGVPWRDEDVEIGDEVVLAHPPAWTTTRSSPAASTSCRLERVGVDGADMSRRMVVPRGLLVRVCTLLGLALTGGDSRGVRGGVP